MLGSSLSTTTAGPSWLRDRGTSSSNAFTWAALDASGGPAVVLDEHAPAITPNATAHPASRRPSIGAPLFPPYGLPPLHGGFQ
jgi:hypothetical protein